MSDAPPDSKTDPAPKDGEAAEETAEEFTQNPDRIAAAKTDEAAEMKALVAALAEAKAELAEVKASLEEKARQIYELNEQKNEITDLARRMRADMANMRRRRETEKANLQLRMVEHICQGFLPLLDDLQRAAAEAAPAEEDASAAEGAESGKSAAPGAGDQALRTGVRLVARRFEESLKKQGFVEIEALGRPFDPRHHDAVHRVPAEAGQEDGEILEVFRRGYFLGDRVIRPASVVVAYHADPATAPPAPPEPEDDGDEEAAPAGESGTETETPSGKEPSGD